MTSNIATEIATFIAFTVVPLAVVVAEPTGADVYSIVGASLASLIGYFFGRERRYTASRLALIIVCSAVLGSIGPGLLVTIAPGFLPESWSHILERLTWHVYASLGLAFGLLGYPIIKAWHDAAERRADSVVNALADKLPGGDKE